MALGFKKIKKCKKGLKKEKETCKTDTQRAASRASCPTSTNFVSEPVRAVAGGAQTAEQLSRTLQLSGFLLFFCQQCEFPENEVTC